MRNPFAASIPTVLIALFLALAAAGTLGYFALVVWPDRILDSSGVDVTQLSVEDILSAQSDIRAATLTTLAGITASTVAFAALWQASNALLDRRNQNAVDWARTFASGANMLDDLSPTTRLAGVITLSGLYFKSSGQSSDPVPLTLASFIRTRKGAEEPALVAALSTIASRGRALTISLAGANLDGTDLSGIDLTNVALDGASLRGAKVSVAHRSRLESLSSVDLAGIVWD